GPALLREPRHHREDRGSHVGELGSEERRHGERQPPVPPERSFIAYQNRRTYAHPRCVSSTAARSSARTDVWRRPRTRRAKPEHARVEAAIYSRRKGRHRKRPSRARPVSPSAFGERERGLGAARP